MTAAPLLDITEERGPQEIRAAFLAGVLVGDGGPAFTLILSQWLSDHS